MGTGVKGPPKFRVRESRDSQNFGPQGTLAMDEHGQTNYHKLCVKAPEERENREEMEKMNFSDQERGAHITVRAAHWIVSENLPLAKFKSVIQSSHCYKDEKLLVHLHQLVLIVRFQRRQTEALQLFVYELIKFY